MKRESWKNASCVAKLSLVAVAMMVSGAKVQAKELPQFGETTQESTTTESEKTQKKETTKKKAKFVKKNGITYYLNADGKKVKSKFVTVKKKTYYLNKKGAVQKGWMKKGGEYYFFDRSTGVQKKSGKADDIVIKNGKAKKTAYNTKKIEAMMKAAALVEKNTKATDSKEEKLKKMFYWVAQGPYKRFRRLREVRSNKGWEIDYANDMLKGSKREGCCVSNACTLAYFARECGYKTVYVCDDTEHAWVEIDGKVYDTLFAEMTAHGGSTKNPNYKDYFKSTYQKTKLVCVNKLKV
ncbi:MAG: transglutaminase domain-containing protein [Eubacteriales bacterium]|nr:transglutaminase domain-containing protein [Eubacteriales bacterium]